MAIPTIVGEEGERGRGGEGRGGEGRGGEGRERSPKRMATTSKYMSVNW